MIPKRDRNGMNTILALAAIASALLLRVVPAQGAVMSPIVGEIERISLDNPADVWSGGRIVVGGDNVVIPRNLLIDLPANRLTLQQLFAQAPPSCLANGETGLAKADRCNIDATGGVATIFANRTGGGDVIAGDVRIAKAVESVTGTVTYVSYTDGYFRLNGIPGDIATGVMVRVNDPSGRHTIQQGLGCVPGNTENCSADPRFGIDSNNYTFAFATGYPPCIPSVVNGASAVTGAGDPFCPSTNRPGHPSPDSTRFAPVVLGDNLSATGNFERVGGVQFLSAHTVKVFADVTTQNLPTQPDYVIFTDVGWDAPAYPASRVRARINGATTLHDSQVDIYSVHYDTANVPHEIPLETTVNNVNNAVVIFLGVPVGVFQTRLDVDFFTPKVDLEPCPDLLRGGVAGAPALCGDLLIQPPSLLQNFRLMSPVAREIVGRTRHKATLSPGVFTRDIRGNLAPNGQYLTPVGIEYPGMEGIDLGRIQTPFSFSGVPWNLDRRLSPGGCIGPCEGTPQPLSPFPFEGIDPRTQSLLAPVPDPGRILSYYPFGTSNVLAWPPADPAPIGIVPVEPLVLACSLLPTEATLSATPPGGAMVGTSVTFTASAVGGTGQYEYEFQAKAAGGSFMVTQPYAQTSSWSWNTTGSSAGAYVIRVNVRNAGSTAPFEARATIAYTLISPATGVSITPDQPSPHLVGTAVQFTASGTGSSGYQYRFWLHNGASWSMVQDYGVGATWSLPASTPVGSYTIAVDVRTSSAVYRDAVAYLPYQIGSAVTPATGVGITPDQGSPHTAGTAVLFTASGTGSSGYQYRFWLHNGASWSMVQDYGVGSTWSLPASTPVGNYTIAVDVRTSTAVYRDAVNYLAYQVSP